MKIKLIAPARKPEWEEVFWDTKGVFQMSGRKNSISLALPTLAALTPFDVKVILTDENVEAINFEEKIDLVGITGITAVIPRAYEIAYEYRKRGVPVVMGGIHVSMFPEEAIEHCDSVVIGEAEGIWHRVVKDAQKKNFQKFYRALEFPDIANSPLPRWDLVKNDKYCFFTVQTSRGCPNNCDFCHVKVINGTKCRHKNIETVIEEIKILQRLAPQKQIFFSDDNLLSDIKYGEELMKELIPLKIKSWWWCLTSMNRLKNDTMLDLMYKAGCRMVSIGIESVSKKSIEMMNKSQVNNVEEYKAVIDKVHSHGISVLGSFVLGCDSDDETVFEELPKFIDQTNIFFSMVYIITPFMGTEFYKKLKNEDRIFENRWEKYNGESVCFKPRLLTIEALQEKRNSVCREIYAYKALYKRLHNLWKQNILVDSKVNSLGLLFRKTGICFMLRFFLYSLFNFNKERITFILKCLCKKNGFFAANSILLALNLHDYAYNLKSPQSKR